MALTQLGMSRDEYEAHVEWQRGEPAVMKYWLRGMAPARSTAALQAEEGVSQARPSRLRARVWHR